MEDENAQSSIGQILALRLIVGVQLLFDPNRTEIMRTLRAIEANGSREPDDSFHSNNALRDTLQHIEGMIQAFDDQP